MVLPFENSGPLPYKGQFDNYLATVIYQVVLHFRELEKNNKSYPGDLMGKIDT